MAIGEASNNRFGARPAWFVFFLTLVVGLPVVAWQAKRGGDAAKTVARAEALGRGAALELQLHQAVSTGWRETLARARVDELAARGYDYLLFAVGTAQQKPVKIAGRGEVSLQDSVQHAIRVRNMDLRLALQKRGGWVSKTEIALKTFGVLLAGTVLGLFVNLLENRQAVEVALTETNRRLARETVERQQAQEDCRSTKDEATNMQADLKKAQVSCQEAESRVGELKGKLKQAELTAAELHTRLEAALRKAEEAVQARKTEREEARATIEQAQKTISEMQGRWETSAGTEKEAVAAAQGRLEKTQAAIAELQARLEAAARSAKQAEESSAAKLKQAEKIHQELKARAEQAEARVSELSILLEKTQLEATADAAAPTTDSNEIKPAETNESAVVEAAVSPAESAAEPVAPKAAKRKKGRRDGQMDLFGGPPATAQPAESSSPDASAKEQQADAAISESASAAEESAPVKPETAHTRIAEEPKPEKPAPARRLPPPPPLDLAEFRKAVGEMLPLLADRDPGAKDCFKANRTTLRSAFSAETFEQFEQMVKGGDYSTALELLKKPARKHGIAV